MKNRILQLCKRLNKFTLDEISTISEISADNLLAILNELISKNKLSIENNVYSYQKKQKVSDKYLIFKYYPKATIDMVLKCFCESIITTKVSHILSIGEPQVQKLYTIFRTLIYERQKKLLDNYYSNNPQNARHRMFFNKEVYLYFYENQIYISKNLLKSKNDATMNKKLKAEFTTIYCYLARKLTHNQNVHNLEYKTAEILWRRGKDFKSLYSDLYNLIN
ncbi:hypothetical protein IJG72_05450 [bacterium]|nr:hypothetical protein [bacterium]